MSESVMWIIKQTAKYEKNDQTKIDSLTITDSKQDVVFSRFMFFFC